MNTWNSIAWLPLCTGLAVVGLILSWFTWRRKGARSAIKGVAWSLLPIALYLTGAIELVGRLGSAIVQFASSFVFSPKTWAGVALLILIVLILMTFGGLPLLSGKKRRARKKELKQESAAGSGPAATAGAPTRAVAQVGAGKPAKQAKPTKGGPADDDGLDADVAEILRRRGIT